MWCPQLSRWLWNEIPVESHKNLCAVWLNFLPLPVYKTVPMSSVMFMVSAMLSSITFLIIFFVFTMPYFIMLLTTSQFPPQGLIKFLSIQDLAYPQLWEAASPGALYCSGVPGQAFPDGGLQVRPAHLHPRHFLWPTSHFPLQWRPGSHGHREIPRAQWGQLGESQQQ